ncbi:Porphobilinogen deaminase [Alkalidesulfovibrio alkalitolerans DSM 16529]|uniref:Porphobilinogen deaminase n=1 Tax=Alkalidesulfovibrio alkalitolerans DSM 16529 TaxID=1121439 RepID=S7UNV3_9BACT|nr:hydroxymethylbilane synthase [Alkalidesulfovibrio alkalitolerans]EPR35679.1 Porphobilinogen deaminase [Alkalidesulfovibrio alkalitolerans DSM 16529]
MNKLVIATRGSMLALWQANHVKGLLEREHAGLSVELLVIKTQGDKILDVPLAKIGGKGLFVKEIEDALLDGRADLAVHSMKDVPTELPEGLVVGVTPPRERPTDTLCSVRYDGLAELPKGAKVGTASLRRQAQLLMKRPDLNIETLRGNLDTRMKKLLDGQYDAIVLATAGLSRLGVSAPKMEVLGPPDFLPAVAQGALGIEYRESDRKTAEMLAFLNDPASRTCVMAERGFLTALQGGCQVPIAGHAVLDGGRVRLEGLVADVHGVRVVRDEISGPADQAWSLGETLARRLLAAGAKVILDEIYAQG